jgi:anti-sigma regulatory factor (Ser/Thr protein kinase)
MKQTYEFSSHASNLASVRAFVRQFLQCIHIPTPELELIVLGIDEACSNVIRHAYREEPSHPITLSCERLKNAVKFKLRDFGAQPDPGSLNVRPLDRIEPGGLGLHLIRRAFDQVDYNLMQRGTELVLLKHLPHLRNQPQCETDGAE